MVSISRRRGALTVALGSVVAAVAITGLGTAHADEPGAAKRADLVAVNVTFKNDAKELISACAFGEQSGVCTNGGIAAGKRGVVKSFVTRGESVRFAASIPGGGEGSARRNLSGPICVRVTNKGKGLQVKPGGC
jgi:hypothetical protein